MPCFIQKSIGTLGLFVIQYRLCILSLIVDSISHSLGTVRGDNNWPSHRQALRLPRDRAMCVT